MSKKLATNVKIFADHLELGLQAAGLDFDSFKPTVVGRTDTKKKGLLFMQVAGDPDSVCVVWEDRIEFGDHSVSLMLDNEFPPTKAAMFLLAAMIQEDPISPPDCPHCSEED